MPFTPSHAAIILPFIRSRYFSATALIIGSMAPDFEYFFTMSDVSVHGHTLAGIFYFDLPVTLFIAFVFHRVVKTSLIDNLPYFIQSKFYELKQFKFEQYMKVHWLVFVISAILGTASHLFWDSFTHADTWIERNLTIYETIIPFKGARYPLYYALQVFSSYLGLAILLIYFLSVKPSLSAQMVKPTIFYWLLLLIISSVVFFLRFYWQPDSLNFVFGVITGISAVSIALIFAGLIRFSNNKIVVNR